jgi:hypothetical protein
VTRRPGSARPFAVLDSLSGYRAIEGAFSAQEAAAIRDMVWRALAAVGIQRDDPTTWRKERPDHLQHLKSDRVFRAVGSNLTLAAIDEVDGIPLQVLENTASAGGVILMHPLLLTLRRRHTSGAGRAFC